MLIPTHKRIANRLYDELGKKFQVNVSRHSFIDGNVKPDIDTSFTRSHYYEKAFHYVLKEILEIRNNKYSRKELGIKLGVISHFICDFSITYHSNDKYRSRSKLQHFNYERRIDDLIRNLNLYKDEFNPSIFENLDNVTEKFEEYISQLQAMKAKPRDDLVRATSNAYHLLKILIDDYAQDTVVDHSGMRVAIFTDTYFSYGSGLSNAIYKMILYYERENVPYILISPKYKDTSYEHQGLNMESLRSFRYSFNPMSKITVVRKKKLRKDLDEFNPNIIQVMTVLNMGRYGLKYGLKNEIPVFTNYSINITDYIDYYHLGFLNRFTWRYLRKFFNKSYETLTPSHETAKILRKNGIEKVNVFSRGVDTSIFSKAKKSQQVIDEYNLDKKVTFLYVGRLSDKKDLVVLCKAYSILKKKYENLVQLIIVGKGPRLKKYKKILPDDVIFAGFVDNEKLSQIYASADIFLFPSSIETFPNAVLEAMASSLPVIAVNKGGVVEAVQDGYNGLLVNAHDVNAFNNAMEHLLLNPKQVKLLGENALTYAKSRSWDFIFYELETYYKKALNKNEEQ